MTRTTSLRASAGALALLAAIAGATAACGREGSLERPGPMFARFRSQPEPTGAQAAERQSQNTTGNTTAASSDKTRGRRPPGDQDDNAPVTKRDLRDPAQRLTPLSASPVQGVPDPVGPPVSTQPPGV